MGIIWELRRETEREIELRTWRRVMDLEGIEEREGGDGGGGGGGRRFLRVDIFVEFMFLFVLFCF